jgi:hypothetical protein
VSKTRKQPIIEDTRANKRPRKAANTKEAKQTDFIKQASNRNRYPEFIMYP